MIHFIVGCKKWDTCAPEAILHALGGKLTDIKGEKYKYHTGVEVKKPEQNEEYSGGSNTNAFSHNLNTNKHPTILIAETPCLLSDP